MAERETEHRKSWSFLSARFRVLNWRYVVFAESSYHHSVRHGTFDAFCWHEKRNFRQGNDKNKLVNDVNITLQASRLKGSWKRLPRLLLVSLVRKYFLWKDNPFLLIKTKQKRDTPWRSSPLNGSPSCRFSSRHRTGTVPHHNTESCDQETVWLTDISSGNRSKTTNHSYDTKVSWILGRNTDDRA